MQNMRNKRGYVQSLMEAIVTKDIHRRFNIRNVSKRIRDAALYTFVYHYTFAAKSKSLII